MDGYRPATYGDAFADVYDEWYGDLPDRDDAVETLAALAGAGGGRLLELGVGTGRLAAPLAAAGVDVWGVDASTAMLAGLVKRPGGDLVHARLGDLADPAACLDGAPPFDVVVVAFNTLFLLPTEADQRQCFARVAPLLAPDGWLVVEAFVPADPPASVASEVEQSPVGGDRPVLTVSEHHPAQQLVLGQHLTRSDDGTVRQRPWLLRYATPAQLDEMAAAAGLVLAERWAGWDRRPFDDDATVHVSAYATL